MKKLFLIAVAFALTACASAPAGQAIQTPAEVAARVCPPVQIALVSLQGLVGLPIDVQANLAAAVPVVAVVCNSTATINSVDLKALADQALPIILQVVKISGMEADKQNEIVLGISAAQIVLATVIQTLPPPK